LIKILRKLGIKGNILKQMYLLVKYFMVPPELSNKTKMPTSINAVLEIQATAISLAKSRHKGGEERNKTSIIYRLHDCTHKLFKKSIEK
jgi:hypothetical protein